MAASSPSNTGDARTDPVERTALSPELSHFLVQLSIGLHKTGTYPSDHPALESAIQALTLCLERLLAIRQSVHFGVARDRLLIDGGATDPSNAVLRSLAESLHRHQVGSLRFERGASPAEVSSLLHELAADARRTTPLGARDAAELGQWPHIRLAPVALDQLELADDGGGTTLDGLWLLLAHATLQGEVDDLDAADRASGDLADAIRRNVNDGSYDRVIADYMSRVGQELIRQGGTSSNVALRLGDLIREVGDDALRLLLDLGSDMAARQQLVRDMSRVLPAQSVIALTRAAADASREAISIPLLRLFGKMAANAEADSGPVSTSADSALRDAITQLVDGWTLADPNPGSYRDALRELTASTRTDSAIASTADGWLDAIRMVDIALETNAVGPAVWRAVNELVRLGRLDELLESLDESRDCQATQQIRAHLGKPEQIGALLRSRQSRRAVEQLLRWTGVEAADALLDGLEATDSRASRRRIMERLVGMGGAIAGKVIERLDKGPWFVKRNMLYMLSEMEAVPDGFDPRPWIENPDPRVRREAIRVGLRVPESRAAAITAGLEQQDTRVLHLVLNAAIESRPPGIAPALIRLLDDESTDPSLRLSAVKALGRTRTVEARRWLTGRVLQQGGWWRRPTLAPKSQELLLALVALRHWRSHRDAAFALALARQSDDIEVRFAATASDAGFG